MPPAAGGCGPISWAEDRVGAPPPGAAGVIWREFMRLGYVRHVLGRCPAMPTAVLAALLAGAPECITADSASHGDGPAGRSTRTWTLRWIRGRG